MNKKDLQNQINMFKAKQTEQESLDDIRTQNNQFKARLEQIDRANSGLTEENDRLKDELSYVSITVKCTFYFKLIIWEMFCVCIQIVLLSINIMYYTEVKACYTLQTASWKQW